MKPLETKGLILRKFEEGDFTAVHSYTSCAESSIYMQLRPNSEAEEKARFYINLVMKEAEKTPIFHFHYAAVFKETGKLIGGCRVSGDGSLGWFLHRDYWNQGFGSEMGKALRRYCNP